MKKVFYLSTCSTCIRILKDLNPPVGIERIDLKEGPIDEKSLDFLFQLTGSYEVLFSKNARKYKEDKVNYIIEKDEDYRGLILSEKTFLKRPVVIYNDIFSIGNNQTALSIIKSRFSTV